MSGEDKFRFGGRLGMGSILGSKNVLGIVVLAPEDVIRKGDEDLKAVNQEIATGNYSRGYRHPDNKDGLGGTGKNEKILDGIGGFTVYGIMENSGQAREEDLVPEGLTDQCTVVRPVAKDRPLTMADIEVPADSVGWELWREQCARQHWGAGSEHESAE